MSKVAIIVGHSLRGTYCEALAERYKAAANTAGHEARIFFLASTHFDPILKEGYGRAQALEPDLQAIYNALSESNHAVFVFPLWCGDMPAILKGFFERLLQPDLIRLQKEEKFELNLGLFPNTSARIIVTMGMPAFFYRLFFGAYAVKLLRRNILQFIGMSPVKTTIYGMVGSQKQRDKSLRSIEALGRRAA